MSERPKEPHPLHTVWYLDWECGWDVTTEYWTGQGYYANKGGIALDAPTVVAGTWQALLDAVEAANETAAIDAVSTIVLGEDTP